MIKTINPTTVTEGVYTTINFKGAAANDKVYFSAPGRACEGPDPKISSQETLEAVSDGASGGFTLKGTGKFIVCYIKSGKNDVIKQKTVSLAVVPKSSSGIIRSIEPYVVTVGQNKQITFVGNYRGIQAGDKVAFALLPNRCPSVEPDTDISSGKATFNFATNGTYLLCFRANGSIDSSEQSSRKTRLIAPTSEDSHRYDVITEINPKKATLGAQTTMIFTGAAANASVYFTLEEDRCKGGSKVSNTRKLTAVSGGASGMMVPTWLGNLTICYHPSGNDLGWTLQRKVTLTVIEATTAKLIASIDTTFVRVGQRKTVTFEAPSWRAFRAGDKATFAHQSVGCGNVTPDVDISSGKGTFYFAKAGNYSLCARAKGSVDSREQTYLGIVANATATATGTAIVSNANATATGTAMTATTLDFLVAGVIAVVFFSSNL